MDVLCLCLLLACVLAPASGVANAKADPNLSREVLANFEAFTKSYNFGRRKLRPIYHITSPFGFLNSPAGFVKFRNEYHIFYQFHPYEGTWGYTNWGHAVSENLIDWLHYPAALSSKEYYEKHGCLSGSAILHNDYITLFYTGNINAHNLTEQNQNIAISSDGIIFQKYLYNPIIKNSPYKEFGHFRNPKVWIFRDKWYMLVGAMSNKQQAQLLLYVSRDLFHWTLNGTVAESFGDMGYMWEHPDLFEMNGQHVLMFSARGIQTDGYRFRNLYQSGYLVGTFNYVKCQFEDDFEVSTATYNMLDYGHDFYAPHTMLDADGRRLLVAWLGMWESTLEEAREGWASMLTIVRQITLNPDGRLLMTPVRELMDLRDEVLEDAWYSPGEAFHAGSRAFELLVNTSASANVVKIVLEWSGGHQFTVEYIARQGCMIVNRGGEDGIRRADWLPSSDMVKWRIFVDYSSVEVFAGEGEVVFSSRIYPWSTIKIKVAGDTQVHMVQYRLRRSVTHRQNMR